MLWTLIIIISLMTQINGNVAVNTLSIIIWSVLYLKANNVISFAMNVLLQECVV